MFKCIPLSIVSLASVVIELCFLSILITHSWPASATWWQILTTVLCQLKVINCHCAECHCAECHCAECHCAECHCVECHSAECHYIECHHAECHYAECH